MHYNLITLQDTAAGGGWGSIIMIVALFAIFYFLMIRPQQKKQKELQKMRDSLTEGNQVVTAGGIQGVIRKIKEKEGIFSIEIDKNVVIDVDKNSVYPASEKPAA